MDRVREGISRGGRIDLCQAALHDLWNATQESTRDATLSERLGGWIPSPAGLCMVARAIADRRTDDHELNCYTFVWQLYFFRALDDGQVEPLS